MSNVHFKLACQGVISKLHCSDTFQAGISNLHFKCEFHLGILNVHFKSAINMLMHISSKTCISQLHFTFAFQIVVQAAKAFWE